MAPHDILKLKVKHVHQIINLITFLMTKCKYAQIVTTSRSFNVHHNNFIL